MVSQAARKKHIKCGYWLLASRPNTNRQARANERKGSPITLFNWPLLDPSRFSRRLRAVHTCIGHAEGVFYRNLTNIPLHSPVTFSPTADHPRVSMDSLTPLDFYFAGPDVESPNRYRPGGYHPVHLGDVYCQRYRVIHKLGFGTYSTVWLARDLQSTAKT